MARTLTLREALLPVIDQLRGIPAQLGLRRFTVQVVVRTWTGTRAGLGYNTDTAQSITVDAGTYAVKVEVISSQDIIASGGLFSTEDLKIGPITPEYTGSAAGNLISSLEPSVSGIPTEIFFKITGPGYATTGEWFKKIDQNVSKNFRYMFTVRKTAEIP